MDPEKGTVYITHGTSLGIVTHPDRMDREEQFRLEALMTDADFRQANTRREQSSTAVKHLRAYDNGQRLILESIGRFLGGLKGATIKRQDA
jgi:hypothetical protein